MDDLTNPQCEYIRFRCSGRVIDIISVILALPTSWRCVLCTGFSTANADDLKTHEDTPEHIEHVRSLDQPDLPVLHTLGSEDGHSSDVPLPWVRTPRRQRTHHQSHAWGFSPDSPTPSPTRDPGGSSYNLDEPDFYLSDSEEFPSAGSLLPSIHGPALPSDNEVKDHRKHILQTAGVSSTIRESQLGNLFAHNDLEKIIQHVCLTCDGWN